MEVPHLVNYIVPDRVRELHVLLYQRLLLLLVRAARETWLICEKQIGTQKITNPDLAEIMCPTAS